MSGAPRSGNESLPLSLAQRVDAACNRFEHAWKEGRRPAVEDFLADTPEADRAVLLLQLIALDIDYRRLAGEDPQPEQYHARFPEIDSQWLAELAIAPLAPGTKPDQAHRQPAADSLCEEKTVSPE